MSKLLLLLKVDLVRTLSLNKIKGSKNVFKNIGMIIVFVFLISSLFTSVGMYTYMGVNFLVKYGLEKYVLPLVYFVCSFSIFYSTIYRAKSYLFNSEDNIFAMPIKPSTILTSRIIVLTLISYIVTTIIFVPAFITYGVTLKLGITYYLLAFVSYLFMPLLPTILGCIFGYIIGYLTSKVKSKKIFETILTYLAVLLIMYVSFNIQSLALKFVNNVELVNKILSSIGFIINSFMEVISNGSIKDLFIYIIANVASAWLFVFIFKNSYVKIVQNLKVENAKSNYIEKEHTQKGVLTTLILKELKMYFSIPIYILNTSFGVVLIFFASIATMFYDKDVLFKMMEIDVGMMPIYLLLIPVVAFSIAMSNTAACSISIEGKNFWILKTMPIKVKDIFLSKIVVNMLIVLPVMILSIILFGISFKMTILQTLIVILLAVFSNITCSMFGIIINLKYPRLDFVSYTQVVKQSLSSFLGIMVPLVFFFGLGALYMALKISIDIYVLLIFTLLLFIIMIQYTILKKWGTKIFNEMN